MTDGGDGGDENDFCDGENVVGSDEPRGCKSGLGVGEGESGDRMRLGI